MERFEMGGVRPFQTDGLFQYKQRWGMTPTPDFWGSRSYLFWVPRNDPTAVDWMETHPVVSLDGFWKGEEYYHKI